MGDSTKNSQRTGQADKAIKFAADRMLGRLAKWLRACGLDVIYGAHLSGYGLIRAARRENRLILTRDRRLRQKQPPPFVLIESDDYQKQIEQLISIFPHAVADRSHWFSRCIVCNAVLLAIDKVAVKAEVPPYVFETQDYFSRCPRCRRIYWPATHQTNMSAALAKFAAG